MNFTLHITVGNDAVQTMGDVASLLRGRVSDGVAIYGEPFPGCSGTIRDDNGTTVGNWTVNA